MSEDPKQVAHFAKRSKMSREEKTLWWHALSNAIFGLETEQIARCTTNAQAEEIAEKVLRFADAIVIAVRRTGGTV